MVSAIVHVNSDHIWYDKGDAVESISKFVNRNQFE